MQLLKPKDVAQQLGVAPITIHKWCERGILPHFRLQGCIRFARDDVDAFVRERRVRAGKRAVQAIPNPRRGIDHILTGGKRTFRRKSMSEKGDKA